MTAFSELVRTFVILALVACKAAESPPPVESRRVRFANAPVCNLDNNALNRLTRTIKWRVEAEGIIAEGFYTGEPDATVGSVSRLRAPVTAKARFGQCPLRADNRMLDCLTSTVEWYGETTVVLDPTKLDAWGTDKPAVPTVVGEVPWPSNPLPCNEGTATKSATPF